MSGRDSEPKNPPRARPGFLGRTKAMSSGGSSGWEATTIGFTLVGCIAAGAGLGWFLDGRFGTAYWTPILFFVGVLAGFREMFVVLGRISKQQEQQKLARQQSIELAPAPTQTEAVVSETPARKRVFQVPPPPLPGQKPFEVAQGEPGSVEDLIERLLEDEKKDGPDRSK